MNTHPGIRKKQKRNTAIRRNHVFSCSSRGRFESRGAYGFSRQKILLQRSDTRREGKAEEEIMTGIKENNMSVFYEETCTKLGWEMDQTCYS